MTTTTRKDPLEVLTLAELDAGSRLLHADIVHHITAPGAERRWEALAIGAYLVARRDDPTVQLTTFRKMTADEIGDYYRTADDGPSPMETVETVRALLAEYVDRGEDVVEVREVLELLPPPVDVAPDDGGSADDEPLDPASAEVQADPTGRAHGSS